MVLSVGQLESDDQGKRPSLQSLSIAVGITLCGPHDPLVTPFFGIIFLHNLHLHYVARTIPL